MLRDITIGQHFPGNSLVHRFDPRLKLVLTILYIVLLFVGVQPAWAVALSSDLPRRDVRGSENYPSGSSSRA